MSIKISGGFVRRAIIRAIIIAIYNIIIFVVPFEHHTAFWWSYAFGMVALVAQWLVTEWTMGIGANVRSQFYGFPVARIGWMYLIAQLALSLIFICVGGVVPAWVVISLYFVLFLLAGAGVVTMDLTRSEIIRQDEKLVRDTATMRTLAAKVNSLAARCSDDTSRKAVNVLAEALRYSDTVSSDDIKDIEAQLSACIADLQFAVDSGNSEGVVSYSQKANALLAERNQFCKLGKVKNH